MMTEKTFTALALSFQGTEQCPHFERIGFKVINKKMFCTYLAKDNTANIFLTPGEQAIFCKMNKHIYPVPNKWGEKGATTFEINKISKEIIQEALISAYKKVLKPKDKK